MNIVTGAGMIAAAFAATTAGGAEQPDARPVRLTVARAGNMLKLTVVGSASVPVAARYTLHVSSDVTSGGNRSTQSGEVRLEPGKAVTLISIAVGNARDGNWLAVLDVQPSTGAAYRIEKRTAD